MLKVIGAIMIVTGCGSFGFKLAADYIREERFIKQLIIILNFMECELQYRMSPLPELCNKASELSTGMLSGVLLSLKNEMEAQISPDAEQCMRAVLFKYKNIPLESARLLERFGRSLGRFDLKGQIKGITDIREECEMLLNSLGEHKESSLRSYRTLALCAGAALVILFI